MFEAAIRDAFVSTAYTSAPHPANNDRGWRIAWGEQGFDLQHVNTPGGPVNLSHISGYLAKYVTKSTEVTGLNVRRVDEVNLDVVADPVTHVGRLVRACWDLGTHPDWWRLRRWAHQFGYGGHITTKSRAFSVTYGFKRWQRTIWRRTEGYPHTWDDEQTERVIYQLGYHATGWITTGDALLANTAAAQARDRHQAGLDALADDPTAGHPISQPLAA
jgi:hypothetical protein